MNQPPKSDRPNPSGGAPKQRESDNLPREVKTEIENLRRLVQTVHDRLHELAKK